MKKEVCIGSASAESGAKSFGYLRVTTGADSSPINIPVIILNGLEEGPTLCVISGTHGDEYEGMEAIRRVGHEVNSEKLKGVFIGIPVANVPAFVAGTRLNPMDHLNMNRVFPGKSNGSITQVMAYIVFKEVISRANYLVDIHGGGNTLSMLTITGYNEVGGELGQETRKLAKAFGVSYLWRDMIEDVPGHILAEGLRKGIPTICIDGLGCEGCYRKQYVDLGVKGITNVMKHLKMLEGKPSLPEKWTVVEGGFQYVRNKCGGFFVPEAKVGEKVLKGKLVARILDPLGNEIERIEAPHDGIVCGIRSFSSIHPREWFIFIGRVVNG